jgi:aminopeptidase N
MSIDTLTKVEAEARAKVISNVDYKVALDLTDDTSVATFTSRTTVTFDAVAGSASFIDLNAASVDSIVLNGRTIPVSAFRDKRIHLDGLAEHNTLEIVAQCNYDQTGVGLHRKRDPVDGAVYVYTHFEPFDAHRVFACFDQPDLKAGYTFTVTAPPHWSVMSNENGTSAPDGAKVTTSFATTEKLSTYLAAVVAGPYKSVTRNHKGIDITIYARASMFPYVERDADEMFEVTAQGLDYYAKVFGRPYPFSNYKHLFVPEFNMGAMENPGCITYNETYLFRSTPTEAQRARRAEVILHEMAHMWFGDLVTMKWWNDLWLNESFATVMALFAQMSATKFTRGALDFADGDKAWALAQDQYSSTHPIASNAKDTVEAEQNFDGITYAKGAAVLRQLLAWLGDDVVFGGLKEYFATYAWKNATLDDLLTVWQKHAGPSRDIFKWADAWLKTTGPNTLTGQRVDSAGRPGFSIVQSPAGNPPLMRPQRVVVGAYSLKAGKLVRDKRIVVDVEGAVTDVPELAGTSYDLILVNDEDLAYAKVRLDSRSLATATSHAGKIQDDLARMLVWSAAWDMVRDAEMPARQFAAMAEHNVAAETDPDTAAGRITSALSALRAYGDPDNYKTGATHLANVAQRLLEKAAPGSLMQLALVRAYVSSATSPAQVKYVQGLYSGAVKLDGLDVSANIDLQWQMLGLLSASGLADEKLIDKQAQQDKTNFGADRAVRTLAARPDADVKAAAWKQILDDRSISLKTYQSVIGGFASADLEHEHLLDPYVDDYVAELPKVWAERSAEEAEAFTGGLFPRFRGRERIAVLAETLAQRTDLPARAQRQLAEIRDNIVRQTKAQALDRGMEQGERSVA